MSAAGEFIDAALQREAVWERAADDATDGLRSYGSSVGAVRGTVRDAFRRYRTMDHDDVLALSSELWDAPVVERRLAAIVVLQSRLALLQATDLTRIEGFLRRSRRTSLVDPLAMDVVGPLVDGLGPRDAERASGVLDRWANDPDPWLRRAALLSPLRPLRAGDGDWDGFVRRVRFATRRDRGAPDAGDDADAVAVVDGAVTMVLDALAQTRPEARALRW